MNRTHGTTKTQEIKHEHAKPVRTILHGSEYMELYPCGCIGRPSCKLQPSGQWRILGATEHNNFGNRVRFYSLADILENPAAIPWQWKNGKQRVHVMDYDHGTRRGWGSLKHYVF